ncbi:MAG: ester cyclase [Pseudomonadota bacterium]
MNSDTLQTAKTVARAAHDALEKASADALAATLAEHAAPDYAWRGVRPFYELQGVATVVETFWSPLRHSFRALHRREDIFLAGPNDAGDPNEVWTASMGHFYGLFDAPWLGIPATGKMTAIRYAEFDRIADGRIAETALFLDVIGVMQQAGCNPLPPQTGATLLHPGPRTNDGVLLKVHDPAEGRATQALVNKMVEDLRALNLSGDDHCPPEYLARTWRPDMTWFGPAGIGSTMTIERYQEHHQYPFRQQLADKTFLGHVARVAEGNYCAFFGWPNLTNRPTGGFMGLPASDKPAEMRVVDVYRRDGDRLAENWVLIDVPHYLAQQGLDVLKRLGELEA